MDSEQVNNLINTIVSGVSAAGVAVGNVYNAFKTPTVGGSTVTKEPVIVQSESGNKSLPVWLPVAGVLVLFLIFKR